MQNNPSDNGASEEIISEHANEHKKLYPVVAIGASAGGLEAISLLLQHLPTDLGMVYVIIQHLSPTHESILPELLERRTQMPVNKVTDSIPIHPNNVYVIPPNTYMSIQDSKLMLSPREKTNGGHHSIDFFMEALAEVYQTLAIGVILSGTATDGTEGIKYIKAEGGITFAQDETARFQGMPRSAIDSGFADFVLSPEGIANELIQIVKKPSGAVPDEVKGTAIEAEMKRIRVILHDRKGVDFSFYKQTTIKRRILRRMALKRLENLADYTAILRNDVAELDMLYRDLLINVTSFFREPSVYQALGETIFPALLRDRQPHDPIRIWCPACATGEEASSIAICLFEFLKDKALNTPIQIFGTDLNELAIERARSGYYAPGALQNVSPQRLKRFFTKTDNKYQIVKAIRDVCIFAVQNLLKDPPFSRMDLISCQNVMIYLESAPQKKILQSFHYGLKPNGFLLLGKSESLGGATDLFSQIDKDLKIYNKKPNSGTNNTLDFVKILPRIPEVEGIGYPNTKNFREAEGDIDVEKESERLLLSRYVPASVVINGDYQIYRFHGPIHRYLQPTSGKATLHLLKMVRDELAFELRTLLNRVKKEMKLVRKEGIKIMTDSLVSEVNIEILPIKANAKEAYYLVMFDEKPFVNLVASRETDKKRVKKPGEQEQRIVSLELELREAREQMKSMTEEFEATREELQSANEEILSSNEELQSINEELETSKEELQSTNEELTTINEELLIRNNDLKESIDYSTAIVETIREPLLLLNADLRVRTANKAFYRFFKLASIDVEGHFLYEIENGRWNVPELSARLSDVASKKRGTSTFELQNIFKDRVLLFKAMHVEVDDKKNDRILLTVQDITLQRQAQQTKDWLAAVVSSSGEGIVSFTSSRIVISWNMGAEKIFGYTAEEMIGKSLSKLTRPDDKIAQLKVIELALRDEIVRQHETAWLHKDGHLIEIAISISPIKNEKDQVQGLTTSIQDITERKLAEKSLKTAQQSLQVAIEAANMGVWEINLADNHVYRSLRHDQIYGYETLQSEWTVEMARKHLVEEDKLLFDASLEKMLETGKLFIELRVKRPNDGIVWLQAMGRVIYDDSGKAIRSAGVVMDITERKALERQKEAFIGIASHELKTPVTSIKAYAQILHAQFLEAEDMTSANLLGKLDKQVDRLTILIKDLLDVTQIAEGQLNLHKEETDLNDLVNEVAEDIQHSATHHIIVKELSSLPKMLADKERIGQVITNLISNAIKYSPKADKIIIRTQYAAENITVSVQDFGIGMSEEASKKVFDRFFRVRDSRTSTFPGLWLGLYISHEIVKRHKGNIWVESAEGKGSTFSFSLPIS